MLTSSRPRRTRRCAGREGGLILANDEEIGRRINSAVFPALQGGPLMHVIAAKAVALREALQPAVQVLRQVVVENAKVLAATLAEAGARDRLRRDRLASDAGRSAAAEADRPGRRDQPRASRHHLQQERHSVRSAEADGDLRHPPRLAGRDDAGFRSGRVPHSRELHRRGVARALARGRPTTVRPKRACAQNVRELCARFPIYGGQQRAQANSHRDRTGRKRCAVRFAEPTTPK